MEDHAANAKQAHSAAPTCSDSAALLMHTEPPEYAGRVPPHLPMLNAHCRPGHGLKHAHLIHKARLSRQHVHPHHSLDQLEHLLSGPRSADLLTTHAPSVTTRIMPSPLCPPVLQCYQLRGRTEHAERTGCWSLWATHTVLMQTGSESCGVPCILHVHICRPCLHLLNQLGNHRCLG